MVTLLLNLIYFILLRKISVQSIFEVMFPNLIHWFTYVPMTIVWDLFISFNAPFKFFKVTVFSSLETFE